MAKNPYTRDRLALDLEDCRLRVQLLVEKFKRLIEDLEVEQTEFRALVESLLKIGPYIFTYWDDADPEFYGWRKALADVRKWLDEHRAPPA